MLAMAAMGTVLFQREKTSVSLLGFSGVVLKAPKPYIVLRLWYCVRLVQEGMWLRAGVALPLDGKGKSSFTWKGMLGYNAWEFPWCVFQNPKWFWSFLVSLPFTCSKLRLHKYGCLECQGKLLKSLTYRTSLCWPQFIVFPQCVVYFAPFRVHGWKWWIA